MHNNFCNYSASIKTQISGVKDIDARL